MIVEALVKDIRQRFQHEKRAQVCLWFDERLEFYRLLPALRAHLAELKAPPFVLLEYASDLCHGQVWLKHSIHSTLAALENEEKRRRQRFLIFLPLSEERLDSPDERGEHHLELLAEYRLAGVSWKVGGKRPTLFGFLRKIGIKLPADPSSQRKLWDGGPDSLLAKYVSKFATRPPAWWETQLTPELAQGRLLGDVDQMLLDLAVSPEGSWQALTEHGLDREFFAAVQDRYGFEYGSKSPNDWVGEFIAVLALTETYQGYGEPADFPFLDRLPPLALRPHHQELMKRWLRDSEGRAAWDEWISEAESHIDLSSWAIGREGTSHGFPHLVHLRWQQTYGQFKKASGKWSATAAFFDEQGARVKREAEFSKGSHAAIGAWGLLQQLQALHDACAQVEQEITQCEAAGDLAQLYVHWAGRLERAHVIIRRAAEQEGLPEITLVADRAYAKAANALNDKFFKDYTKQKTADIKGIPHVTAQLEADLWNAHGRRAVIIADALRYDCGLALEELLRGSVEVKPLRATMPTITPIGMTALMPISSAVMTLEVKKNNPHPRLNGKDATSRKNRLDFLTAFGATCRDIDSMESTNDAPEDLGDLLVVFGHDAVDHIGHGSGDNLIRHVDLEVRRIANLMRKLHRWGYETVHVVTDHGFILLEESKLPAVVECDKDYCQVRKERFALVPATADVPLKSFPFDWDPEVRVAVPPGMAFFKAEKSFSHGGAALQELIIPHVISRSQVAKERRIGVEVVLPTYELMRTAIKVTLRPASVSAEVQMSLFTEKGRTLSLDVLRASGEERSSVLAGGKPKEIRLAASDSEKGATLFFHTAQAFTKGELLELDIRDVETSEQFPPGGVKLTVGRDM